MSNLSLVRTAIDERILRALPLSRRVAIIPINLPKSHASFEIPNFFLSIESLSQACAWKLQIGLD